jgi:drug/metabolite transporter (DMT)-like permease
LLPTKIKIRSFHKPVSLTIYSGLLLPSALYFVANITAIHALSHVRSYIFTAIMNARIVVAALLSTCLLNKSINGEQWRAILIIFCAATMLCLEDMQKNNLEGSSTWKAEAFGMMIALSTASASAGGGVLIEKYLNRPINVAQFKSVSSASSFSSVSMSEAVGVVAEEGMLASSSCSFSHSTAANTTAPHVVRGAARESAAVIFWEQQGVLALFGAVFAGLYILLFLDDDVRQKRLMKGWTGMTVVLMEMQAIQGILVAMCIQKCGIIFRLILGTISICCCIVLEWLLFREPVAFRELLSIIIVIVGSHMYSNVS